MKDKESIMAVWCKPYAANRYPCDRIFNPHLTLIKDYSFHSVVFFSDIPNNSMYPANVYKRSSIVPQRHTGLL